MNKSTTHHRLTDLGWAVCDEIPANLDGMTSFTQSLVCCEVAQGYRSGRFGDAEVDVPPMTLWMMERAGLLERVVAPGRYFLEVARRGRILHHYPPLVDVRPGSHERSAIQYLAGYDMTTRDFVLAVSETEAQEWDTALDNVDEMVRILADRFPSCDVRAVAIQ